MMKKHSAFFALAAASALCLGLLGGCAGQGEGATEPLPSSSGTDVSSSVPSAASGSTDTPSSISGGDLPYQPIPIDRQRYEGETGYIEFADQPETDAETLVCDEYYSWVIDTDGARDSLWLAGPMHSGESMAFSTDVYEWVRVDRVEQLEADEVKAALSAGGTDEALFGPSHKANGGEMSYEEYVQATLDAGYLVVRAEVESEYTEETRAQGPQLPDGESEEYWLLRSDPDGNLRLYDNTRFYLQFSADYLGG